MKSSRTWFVSVLRGIVILSAAIFFLNCVFDPYGILRKDFSKQYQEPNQNFVKTKYLLDHRDRFDSLLFGSSRVNFIDITKIQNGKYYNYWYSEGVPAEHLANLRLLIQRGVRIKNVVVGLDDFSYLVDPQTHLSNLLRQPHPLTTGKSYAQFYGEYFFRLSSLDRSAVKYVEHNVLKKGALREKGGRFDIEGTGRMFIPSLEEEIVRDPANHDRDSRFLKPTHYEGDNMANTLRDLRDLAALTRRYGIHLVLFINPIHHTTYLDTNLRQFVLFKRRLADISEFYDFSGLNSVTTNNRNYYETSHYRELVGDMMLRRMFGFPRVTVPGDFGVLVTRRNVDDYLKRMITQLKVKNPLAVREIEQAVPELALHAMSPGS